MYVALLYIHSCFTVKQKILTINGVSLCEYECMRLQLTQIYENCMLLRGELF